DARRRHEPASGADRGDRADRPLLPALGRDARGPALLRARDRGARAAAHARRAPAARGGGRIAGRERMTAAASTDYGKRAAHQARERFPALLVLVATIASWEGGVRVFDVQKFLLPAPSDIGSTL